MIRSAKLRSSAEARVMRLRGYDNAIVPQVAAQVIGAFMEFTSEGNLHRDWEVGATALYNAACDAAAEREVGGAFREYARRVQEAR